MNRLSIMALSGIMTLAACTTGSLETTIKKAEQGDAIAQLEALARIDM